MARHRQRRARSAPQEDSDAEVAVDLADDGETSFTSSGDKPMDGSSIRIIFGRASARVDRQASAVRRPRDSGKTAGSFRRGK